VPPAQPSLLVAAEPLLATTFPNAVAVEKVHQLHHLLSVYKARGARLSPPTTTTQGLHNSSPVICLLCPTFYDKMIKKSAVLAGNDEFWHSAIIDGPISAIVDDDTTSSSCSSDKQLSADGLPAAHHQLLSGEGPSYECLTGYDHRGEDATTSLLFEEDTAHHDLLSLTSHGDDQEDDEDNTMSCCRQEKMSSVKKRGGGSWLLGFARLQSRPDVDDDYSDDEEEVDQQQLTSVSAKKAAVVEDDSPPGLVRTNSASDLSFSTSSSDSLEDDDDTSSTTTSSSKNSRKKSVGFNTSVKIQPIPHSSTYTPCQRRKMYSTSLEVRKNKIRNKKEYRYDGYDWRNVTEEWEMSVDMVTGELIHPVHNHVL
jgi:hypothetical protein